MGSSEKIWDKIIFYLKRPDMRLFWIFLGLATAIILMEIFYVPGYLVFISSLVFLGIAAVIFINNYRLAKANFTIQLKKKQLEGMIISLQDGVIAYDPNFKIMVFNLTAEEIFKIKAEEVLGFKSRWALKAGIEDLTKVKGIGEKKAKKLIEEAKKLAK